MAYRFINPSVGTDDTTSIQGMIDAFPSTGGEIVLGPGTFAVSGIRLDGLDGSKTGVTLRGQGRATTIRKMDNSLITTSEGRRAPVIQALNGNGFVVKDLNVEGNLSRGGLRPTFTIKHTLGATFGSAGQVRSVALDGTTGTQLSTDRIFIVTASGAGQTSSASNISVDVGLGYVTEVTSQPWNELSGLGYLNSFGIDNDFAYRSGIYMNGTSAAIADCVVDNVHVTDTVYGGVLIGSGPLFASMKYSGSVRSRISNCHFKNNGGSNIDGGYKTFQTITNCTFFGGNSAGIKIDTGCTYCSVTNCVMDGNSTVDGGGIIVYGANYTSIVGNTFKDCSPGIWIDSGSLFSTVQGNTITGGSVGITILSSNSVGSVIGNTVTLCTSHGISLNGVKQASVHGNVSVLNGGSGIRFAGTSSVCSCMGNLCQDNATAGGAVNSGILVSDLTGSTFIGNRCVDANGGSGTQNYGINETGAAGNNVFLGNILYNNKTGAKVILSTSHDLMNTGSSATDVDLLIDPRGAGLAQLGTYSAGTATDSTGYITIKDAGGTSRKLMVQA